MAIKPVASVSGVTERAVTLVDGSVVARFHRVTVQLSPDVLKVFDAHRQTGWFSREAGGQLFADIKG